MAVRGVTLKLSAYSVCYLKDFVHDDPLHGSRSSDIVSVGAEI